MDQRLQPSPCVRVQEEWASFKAQIWPSKRETIRGTIYQLINNQPTSCQLKLTTFLKEADQALETLYTTMLVANGVWVLNFGCKRGGNEAPQARNHYLFNQFYLMMFTISIAQISI